LLLNDCYTIVEQF